MNKGEQVAKNSPTPVAGQSSGQVSQGQAKAGVQPQAVVHPLTDAPKTQKSKLWVVFPVVAVILLGAGTGYVLAKMKTGQPMSLSSLKQGGGQQESTASKVTEAGINSSEDFPDEAEGMLEKNDGSVTTEGTHRLIREGGPSQTVYLTSSVVDLSQFEGKKVQVKGETFTAHTAGWLMDVGWVKEIK